MKIDQMLPNYWYGDAIGNHVTEIQKAILQWGQDSTVYADVIHKKLSAKKYTEFEKKSDDDTWLIYHYSTGSKVNRYALENAKNLILIYHNVTPPEFFENYDKKAADNCRSAIKELSQFSDKVKLAIGVSEFNAEDLRKAGFKNVTVAPLILDFNKMEKKGECSNGEGQTKILFVGRVAPHKGHEDLIKIFYFYNNYVDKNSQLVIVGGFDLDSHFYRKLVRMTQIMDLPDVVFTGAVTDEELGAHFNSANIFLCMSRHEGFCVPIIEAMKGEIPVVALARAAVTSTMNGAGVLIDNIKHNEIAELLGLIVEDEKLREEVVESQLKRAEEFDKDRAKAIFKDALVQVLGDKFGAS